MTQQIDREIKELSVKDAKRLRQDLITKFDHLIKKALPDIKKGNGRFWTTALNDNVYFYVTFEFPKYLDGDSTVSIFYGIENIYTKPVENMLVRQSRHVSYPYKIHHQLFEFNNVAWNKQKVGYLYWKLLMQQNKLHYYTSEQTNYVIEMLFPAAITQISRDFKKFYNKFHNSNRKLPDIRIKNE